MMLFDKNVDEFHENPQSLGLTDGTEKMGSHFKTYCVGRKES